MKSILVLLVVLMAAACGKTETDIPPPVPIPADAVGHYCNMTVTEHAGPKGQAILKGQDKPLWFSSARDAIAFTLLPEEPKDFRALYVSDMGQSSSWEHPEAWVEARRAFYVIGSRRTGGMGADEAIPFSDQQAAATFANANGGRVVDFHHIPEDYILGTTAAGDQGGQHGTGH